MYVRVLKRVLDMILFLIAFPCWLVILAIVGPIIHFEDKGPVFYVAPRLGKDGKIFNMYKFRTMKVNCPDIRNEDGSTYNAEDDPRLTKVGRFLRKTSLDETPQLLNIIKSEMSIIGPRPDLPDHFALYRGDEISKLKVKPGASGYNQAYFRNTCTWRERIINDVYYLEHVSFFLDCKIFFKTARSVLKTENVFLFRNNSQIEEIEVKKTSAINKEKLWL